MHDIVIPGLYCIAGIMAYTTVYHFVIGICKPIDKTQILFSCMCFLAVFFSLSTAVMLKDFDSIQYLLLLKVNVGIAILMFAIFPWFIAEYTNVRNFPLLLILTFISGLMFAVNIIKPNTLQFDDFHGIAIHYLPWGEAIVFGKGHHSAWMLLGMIGLLTRFAYALYAFGKRYRSNHQSEDLAILISTSVITLSFVQGMLVRLGVFHGIIFGPLGFVFLVLAISASLGYGTQKRLRTSEADFRSLFENSPTGMLAVEPGSGRILQANSLALQMTGYNADTILDRSIIDLIMPEDVKDLMRQYERMRRGLVDRIRFERPVNTVDGKHIIAANHISAHKDNKGRISHFVVNSIDITESKMTETALQLSEETFRTIFENSPLGIFRSTPDGKFIKANATMAKIAGYNSTVEMIDSIHDIAKQMYVNPQVRKRAVARLINGKRDIVQIKSRFKRTSGEEFSGIVTLKLVRNSKGDIMFMDGILEDISERVQTEEALRESEGKLQTLFELSPLGIVMNDIDGHYIEFNEAFCNICGYTEEQLKKLTGWDLTPDKYGTQEAEQLKLLENQGRFGPYEKELIRRDGSLVPVRANGIMVTSQDGQPYIWSIIEDISEQKQAEDEHEQLLHIQKMDSIGRLAGGIAHDFNNMLGAIIGYSELAMDKMDASKREHKYVKEIAKAANRSADLTRQLLTFARKNNPTPKAIDLNDTVEGMLNMLRRLIGEGICVEWDTEPDLWTVFMDPSQLDQILANLCVNARDAIDGSGRINIHTSNVHLSDMDLVAHPELMAGDFVRLSVTDDGCGIEKGILDNVFEPFFTTKKTGEGTGLGLSTVYGIVKQSEGFITIDTESGMGTTFNIFLQRHGGEVDRESMIHAVRKASSGNETILVVEDEPSLLTMTKHMLRECGYSVLAASNPDEAVTIVKDHIGRKDYIHMMLTDVVMPGMNGIELSKVIEPLCPDIRLLFMSGYMDQTLMEDSRLESNLLIQKPFPMGKLVNKVRELLDA